VRRLRRKRFIQQIRRTQRYELSSERRRLAVFLTNTYTRIVNPSLADLDPALPADIANRVPLAKVSRAFEPPSKTASPRPPSRPEGMTFP
jgi:hypothetical protein